MIIDAVCLVFCLLYAVYGYFAGAVKQTVGLIALVVSSILAPLACPFLENVLQAHFATTSSLLHYPALVGTWLVFYIILSILGKKFASVIVDASPSFGAYDRWAGAFFGLIMGLLVVLFTGFMLNVLEKPFAVLRPSMGKMLKESYLVQSWGTQSPLRRFLPDEMRDMAGMAGDMLNPIQGTPSAEEPKAVNPAENKAIGDILRDSQLMEKLRKGEMEEVLRDPKFKELMNDEKAMELLHKIQGGQMPKISL